MEIVICYYFYIGVGDLLSLCYLLLFVGSFWAHIWVYPTMNLFHFQKIKVNYGLDENKKNMVEK